MAEAISQRRGVEGVYGSSHVARCRILEPLKGFVLGVGIGKLDGTEREQRG